MFKHLLSEAEMKPQTVAVRLSLHSRPSVFQWRFGAVLQPACCSASQSSKKAVDRDDWSSWKAKCKASLPEAPDWTSDASERGTNDAPGILTVAYLALVFSFLSVLFGAGCVHFGCAAMLPRLRWRHVRYGCLARAGDCLWYTPGRRRGESDAPQGPRTRIHLLPQTPPTPSKKNKNKQKTKPWLAVSTAVRAVWKLPRRPSMEEKRLEPVGIAAPLALPCWPTSSASLCFRFFSLTLWCSADGLSLLLPSCCNTDTQQYPSLEIWNCYFFLLGFLWHQKNK